MKWGTVRKRLDERRERIFIKVQSSSPHNHTMGTYILKLQSEIYDLDEGYIKEWEDMKDDYETVHKKLTDCERQLGLARGNYKGF